MCRRQIHGISSPASMPAGPSAALTSSAIFQAAYVPLGHPRHRTGSMTGRKGSSIVLQPRDHTLLEWFDVLPVIDREQTCQLGLFESINRANTRLRQLKGAGLLTSLVVGTVHGGHKYLYARTRLGAA